MDDSLTDRVRAHLPGAREVPMFGGRSFMVDDAMVVAARKNGDLLVRVDPERHEDMLDRAGASRAMMGAEREMGPGWISVSADALVDDAALTEWIEVALDRHRRR